MTKLLDDEIEEDEQFWNQDALKEVGFLLVFALNFLFEGLYVEVTWSLANIVRLYFDIETQFSC